MATIPPGADPQITYISGVTIDAKVAATAFGTWQINSPATYGTSSNAYKWGDTTLFPEGSGARISYWFDIPSAWGPAEQNAFLAGLHSRGLTRMLTCLQVDRDRRRDAKAG